MNALVYPQAWEIREDHELRQKGWIGSFTIHALLLAFLFLYPHLAVQEAALTEFTWLEESGETEELVEVAAPPVVAAAEDPVIEEPTPQPTSPARFERVEAEEAEVEPKPQSLRARDDRLSDRLAALRDNKPNLSVEAPQRSSLLKATASEVPKSSVTEKSDMVRRAGTPSPAPVELKRTRSLSRTPSLATVKTSDNMVRPDAVIPPDADLTVRRTLSGAALAGPAADRPVRKYIMPEYPEWAKREGVEGSVTLGFVVLPDGRVKKNVMVHRTSGYEDFDRRAQEALRLWRFEPLPPGSTDEQWGSITVHFRLTS